MRTRFRFLAGLLLLGGCADDVGYRQSHYASEPQSVAGYYRPIDYRDPYLPSSPVYGNPYVSGPVMGGVYAYGDARDDFGGPVFSPYHGIACDRRRLSCWNRNGYDPRWTGRFFGRHHSDWNYADWHSGNQGYGGWAGHGPAGNNCGGYGQPPC
jgi:hypothetical protein